MLSSVRLTGMCGPVISFEVRQDSVGKCTGFSDCRQERYRGPPHQEYEAESAGLPLHCVPETVVFGMQDLQNQPVHNQTLTRALSGRVSEQVRVAGRSRWRFVQPQLPGADLRELATTRAFMGTDRSCQAGLCSITRNSDKFWTVLLGCRRYARRFCRRSKQWSGHA
jgi:hypothetical protein